MCCADTACYTRALDGLNDVHCSHILHDNDHNEDVHSDTTVPFTRVSDNSNYSDHCDVTHYDTTACTEHTLNDNKHSDTSHSSTSKVCLNHTVNNDGHIDKNFVQVDTDFLEFNDSTFKDDNTDLVKFTDNVLTQSSLVDSLYGGNVVSQSTSNDSLNHTKSIFNEISLKNSWNDSGIFCNEAPSKNSLNVNKGISMKDFYENTNDVNAKSFKDVEMTIKNICQANDAFTKSYKDSMTSDTCTKSDASPVVYKDTVDKNLYINSTDFLKGFNTDDNIGSPYSSTKESIIRPLFSSDDTKKSCVNDAMGYIFKDLLMRCPEPIQNDTTFTVSYMSCRQPAPKSTRDDTPTRNSNADRARNLYTTNSPMPLQDDFLSRVLHRNPPTNNFSNDLSDQNIVRSIPTSTSTSASSSINSFANPLASPIGQFRGASSSSRNLSTANPLVSPRDSIFTEPLPSARNSHTKIKPGPSMKPVTSRKRTPNSFQEMRMRPFSPLSSPRESNVRHRSSPPANTPSSGFFDHFTTPHRGRYVRPTHVRASSLSSPAARNFFEYFARNRGATSLNSPPEEYRNPQGATSLNSPPEEYQNPRGASSLNSPPEEYRNPRGVSSLNSPPEEYRNPRGVSSLNSPPEEYRNARGATRLNWPPEEYRSSRGASSLNSPPEEYRNSRGASSLNSPPEEYRNPRGASSRNLPPEEYRNPRRASSLNSPSEEYRNPRGASSLNSPPEEYRNPRRATSLNSPLEEYRNPRGTTSLNSPPEEYLNPFEVRFRRGSDRGSSSRFSSFSSECSSQRSDAACSRGTVVGTTFQLQTPRSDDGFASGGSQFNSPSNDSDFDFGRWNRNCHDPSRSVDRDDLFEINRKKKMEAAIEQYHREREQQRMKQAAVVSTVNRTGLYSWKDEFSRLQSDRNTQGARAESTNRSSVTWYDKKTWTSEQLACSSTVDKNRQARENISIDENEPWVNSSRRNEERRNEALDFSLPTHLLPSNLLSEISESPPPSTNPSSEHRNDEFDALQLEATAKAFSIVSLAEKIKEMNKIYLEPSRTTSAQEFSQPVWRTPDQEHNDELPLKMVNDVLNSESCGSDTATQISQNCPLERVAHVSPANRYLNIGRNYSYQSELRLDMPLQEELWRPQAIKSEVETSKLSSDISVRTPGQLPHHSGNLLQVELFCSQYGNNGGSSNDSGLQDIGMIQPTVSNERENINANQNQHTELSHNISVDESLSKLLPYWLANEMNLLKTDSEEESAAHSLNRKDKTKQRVLSDTVSKQKSLNVTHNDSIESIWDKEVLIRNNKRREYTQTKEMFRKLINDIKEQESKSTELKNKRMNESESRVGFKYNENQEKSEANANVEHVIRVKSRDNSYITQDSTEVKDEPYDPDKFCWKEDIKAETFHSVISRDQVTSDNNTVMPIGNVCNEKQSAETDQDSNVDSTTEEATKTVILSPDDDRTQVKTTKTKKSSNATKVDVKTKKKDKVETTVTTQQKQKPVSINKGKKKKKPNNK